MNSQNPLVSVIIPTRNSERTLDKCLASVKNQSYKNIELIVVDNNSTDNTKEIAGKYTDKVFNFGPERSAQRNFGVKNSNGDFLLVIDSDMELSREVIKSCVNKIKSDSSLKGVIIPEESFGDGFWAQCKKLERSFYVGVEWMEGARFFDRKIYEITGGYNENLISGEDWDLSQKIEVLGKIGRINDFIYHNEGRLSLFSTLKKKFYYAKSFHLYINQSRSVKLNNQIGIIKRYGLFFRDPAKLFINPLLGLGMIFMKTLEFIYGGIGYLQVNFKPKNLEIEVQKKNEYVPTISFIIPTLNAQNYIRNCLESIYKQEYPGEKMEVIIIDGGSSDGTISIVKEYPVRILENKKIIAEYGKAIGVRESKGEYCILMDSDNEIVESFWLKRMVEPIIQHPELFGVESPLSYDKTLTSLNRYFARIRIADSLAQKLVSKPKKIFKFANYNILNFSHLAVLITGANGFLWNKKMILGFDEWKIKFEEANFSTFVHEKIGANYAIPKNISIRHYYCNNISEYLLKRKKIALKIKERIKNKEYIWVEKSNYVIVFLSILYLGTIIGPTIEALYKNIKYRTFDYSWHPVVGFLTVWVYGWSFILKD